MFPSSGPPSGWAGEFSCPYVVKLGLNCVVFNVFRELVLGIVTSLGRVWVSHQHCFIVSRHVCASVYGFVAKQACLVFAVKQACFCEELLTYRGVLYSLLFSTCKPIVGLTDHLLCPLALSLSTYKQMAWLWYRP